MRIANIEIGSSPVRLSLFLKRHIVRASRFAGVVVTSLESSPEGRIAKLLKAYRIDTVFDVGANSGQYASMYEGAMGFEEIIQEMREKSYRLVHLIPGFFDRATGEQLEVDGVFHRRGGRERYG